MREEAPLPDGWTQVESRSRPGEISYMDAQTGRRVKQRPPEPAAAVYERMRLAIKGGLETPVALPRRAERSSWLPCSAM